MNMIDRFNFFGYQLDENLHDIGTLIYHFLYMEGKLFLASLDACQQ